MSTPSSSKERIIPIQLENEDTDNDLNMSTLSEKSGQLSSEDVNTPKIQDPLDILTVHSANVENNQRTLPLWNSPEKIVLVIDRAEDDTFTSFKLNNGDYGTPFEVVKKSLEFFLSTKNCINQQHEYAIVVLNESDATWLKNFTNNVNDLINTLDAIEACKAEDIFNMNSLFDTIIENTLIPEIEYKDDRMLPPPFVLRVVLFYGRSYTLPVFEASVLFEELLNSPYFTLDVLMSHEPVSPDNNCEKIFETLQNIDKKGFAYFFSVVRDIKLLYDAIAKLLGHPLQRPIQKLAQYNIKDC